MPIRTALMIALMAGALPQAADRYVAAFVSKPAAPAATLPDDLVCYDCNLVLISVDTLRPDHLGCYGYGRPTSPAINEFCEQSVVFEQAMAPAPSTLPSHASLFTGLIPPHHGARASSRTPLADEYLTLAELFSAAGYATAAFVDGGQMSPKWNLGQGFDIYEHQQSAAYLMNVFSDRVQLALDWLDNEQPDAYMLFLHTYEVHHPYTPAPEFLDAVAPDRAANMEPSTSLETLRRINNGRIDLTRRILRDVVTTYDAEIRSMDQGFGQLLEALRARPDWDRTIVVLTSDHGEEFGEHGMVGWHSHTLFDELLRIPLVVRMPGDALAGRRVGDMVRLIDVAPTLVNLFGLSDPGTFEGISLLPVATGGATGTRAGANSAPTLIAQRDRWQEKHPAALRTPRWKLYDGRLYDLLADPLESRDVSHWYTTVTETLTAQLQAALDASAPLPTEAIDIDPALREQLRSLGYIQ